MEMFNVIVNCFRSIYTTMNTISVFGICSLWTFCICLIVIWCLISAYMAFVRRGRSKGGNE